MNLLFLLKTLEGQVMRLILNCIFNLLSDWKRQLDDYELHVSSTKVISSCILCLICGSSVNFAIISNSYICEWDKYFCEINLAT